jgi:hypothetical protein
MGKDPDLDPQPDPDLAYLKDRSGSGQKSPDLQQL